MRRRFSSRPTPGASVLAVVIGVFMLIFALSVIPIQSAPAPAALFIVVWVLALIGGIIYHLVNATRPGGVPTKIIESEEEGSPSGTTAERLQELEKLRNQQLISDAEYEAKRLEILKDL